MAAFAKLTRGAQRALAPGQSISEHGITYTRLAGGDGRWSVNVMVSRKRHHQVVGNESEGFTRTQAEELVAKLKAGKRERALGIRKTVAVTLREASRRYLEHLEATGGKDIAKKRERLELHLLRHMGNLQLAAITQTDLKRYAAARLKEAPAAARTAKPGTNASRHSQKTISAATVNRELAIISHLFNLAADTEELNLLPAIPFRVKRLKEPEGKPVYLQPVQAQALIHAAANDESEHILAFCMVGLHTGMRRSAILRVRVDELDLRRRVLWVDRDKAGERQQPMTRELCEFLAIYVERLDGPWLFPSPKSRTGHAANLDKAFRRVVKAAGLEKVITPHKMRHTMATNAAHAGVDAATLQAMGGWKSRRMVERYTHAGAMSEAMDKLQAALSGPVPQGDAGNPLSRAVPARARH
jgi:integrase